MTHCSRGRYCRYEVDDPRYRLCTRCRAAVRERQRRFRGLHITQKAKARAWLAAGPRTNAQLAELLGISRQHAATLRYQLKQER